MANDVPLLKTGGWKMLWSSLQRATRESLKSIGQCVVTSVVGKLLESTLADKIYMNLDRQGLIRESQLSFVHKRSCLMNLIEFFGDATKKVDEGRVVLVYVDFSKAFDQILLGRLLWKVGSWHPMRASHLGRKLAS